MVPWYLSIHPGSGMGLRAHPPLLPVAAMRGNPLALHALDVACGRSKLIPRHHDPTPAPKAITYMSVTASRADSVLPRKSAPYKPAKPAVNPNPTARARPWTRSTHRPAATPNANGVRLTPATRATTVKTIPNKPSATASNSASATSTARSPIL